MHNNTSGMIVLRNLCSLEWLALIAIFLFAGITGHDPWKQDETYSFGIIYHFYTTHTWLVPVNAGVPFMEKPPFYYWSAVMFCKWFAGILPLHDAARLTSFFYMLVTTLFTWRLSQILFRDQPECRNMGWITLALLLGSLGLVRHAHDMFTDVALLSGTVIALYGIATIMCAQGYWKRAGAWLGLGMGIAFMSKGFLIPAVLVISGAILWIILPGLRTRKTMAAIGIALVVASPFLLIWPTCLYHYSPALFMQWFWYNNIGRFLGFSVPHLGAGNEPYYFLQAVLWFAFPSFPLACVAAASERSHWQRPGYLLPLTVSVVGMALLLASASARALYLLPLLPAFSLLAAQALQRVPSWVFRGWNVIMRIIFLAGMIVVWLTWWSLLHSASKQPIPQLSSFLGTWLPLGFVPLQSQGPALILATALSLFFLASLRLSPRTSLNTAYIWLVGIAVLWGTSHTLLLPWIDETKSYRPVFMKMNAFVEQSPYASDCIGTYNLGESISPMLQYFGNPRTLTLPQNFDGTRCRLLLTSAGRTMPENTDLRWNIIWKGSRMLDTKDEELRLYARKNE